MDRTAVIAFISSEISSITGMPVAVSGDTLLDSLPLDSLQCVELTTAVEDEYDIMITCGERVSVETIGDFADLVARNSVPLLQAA